MRHFLKTQYANYLAYGAVGVVVSLMLTYAYSVVILAICLSSFMVN